jgi:alpha-L-fucosidase 2
MKIHAPNLSLGFLTSLFCIIAAVSMQAAEVRSDVDWEKFLARQDLVWNSAPTNWESGASIGNGLLGAMIHSEGTNALQWDVGRSDVTDKGDRVAIGRFVLTPPEPPTSGTMRLELWNAEAHGELKTSNDDIHWRSLTHAKDLVNVIELTEKWTGPVAGLPPQTKIEFQHLPPLPARAAAQNQPIPEDQLNPGPTFGHNDYNAQWCMQSFKGGGGYVVAWARKNAFAGQPPFFLHGGLCEDRHANARQSDCKSRFCIGRKV